MGLLRARIMGALLDYYRVEKALRPTCLERIVFPKATHPSDSRPRGWSQERIVVALDMLTHEEHNMPCHNVNPSSAP